MVQYSNKQMKTSEVITVVGIDLGKTWIQICGQDATETVRLTGKYKPARTVKAATSDDNGFNQR